jgi:DNA invertase Pin-like site-specific DNA recombinase
MKRKPEPSRKAVAYCRVSTGRQDVSLADQQEKIEAYCKLAGLELVETISERSVSGRKVKLAKRPEGARIDELVAGGVGHIVTLKLDRMFRNAADCLNHVEAWETAGIALHLVDFGGQSVNAGTAIGKMFITILVGFAEFEGNIIAERTTAALAYKKSHGMVYSATPYGFEATPDGHLSPEPREQSIIGLMRQLRDKGRSYHKVADHLNAIGIPTKQEGGAWHAMTIKRVLDGTA